MNSNKNILRQIVDLQSQLEKAIQEKDELNSFETIFKFNDEIKSFLLENISDEFILNHIKSIPSLSLIDLESSNSIGFIGFLAGTFMKVLVSLLFLGLFFVLVWQNRGVWF